MTPKERVFETLRKILEFVKSDQGLEEARPDLEVALERALTWETELIDKPEPG